MNRLLLSFAFLLSFWLQACLKSNARHSKPSQATVDYFLDSKGDTIHTISRPAEQWKTQLSAEAYHVLREKGTERAFTGIYHDIKEAGTYACNGCGLILFTSKSKFDSGTGWPSFYAPVDKTHVMEEADNTYGMRRVEVLCRRCGGHVGHVFNDGPPPTGLRYCMNSVSLHFMPE